MNKKRFGPKHSDDLADIDELLLSTGSRIGETWHQLSNMQRRWRGLRAEADLDWGTFHSFRRTVATQTDADADADAAARQLGHASKEVTEKHYINRAPTIVDLSGVIEERFAPKRPATTNGPNERAE